MRAGGSGAGAAADTGGSGAAAAAGAGGSGATAGSNIGRGDNRYVTLGAAMTDMLHWARRQPICYTGRGNIQYVTLGAVITNVLLLIAEMYT